MLKSTSQQTLKKIVGLPKEVKAERRSVFSYFPGLQDKVKNELMSTLNIDFTNSGNITQQINSFLIKEKIKAYINTIKHEDIGDALIVLRDMIQAGCFTKEDKDYIIQQLDSLKNNGYDWITYDDTKSIFDNINHITNKAFKPDLSYLSSEEIKSISDLLPTGDDIYYPIAIKESLGFIKDYIEGDNMTKEDISLLLEYLNDLLMRRDITEMYDIITLLLSKGIIDKKDIASLSYVSSVLTEQLALSKKEQHESFEIHYSSIINIYGLVALGIIDKEYIAHFPIHTISIVAPYELDILLQAIKFGFFDTSYKVYFRQIFNRIAKYTTNRDIKKNLQRMRVGMDSGILDISDKAYILESIKEGIEKFWTDEAINTLEKSLDLGIVQIDDFNKEHLKECIAESYNKSHEDSAVTLLVRCVKRGFFTKDDKDNIKRNLESMYTDKEGGKKGGKKYVIDGLNLLIQYGFFSKNDPKDILFIQQFTDNLIEDLGIEGYIGLMEGAITMGIYTTTINPQLRTYMTDNITAIEHAVQLSRKFIFDIDFFEQLIKKYPIFYDKKDVYGKVIEEHYDNLKKAFLQNDGLGVRHIISQGYAEHEKNRVDTLVEHLGDTIVYDYLGQGARDPHDAVQHTVELLRLFHNDYEDKKQLFYTLLREIGASNAGYYEFNQFLMHYDVKWYDIITKEFESEDGIRNPKFTYLASTVLQKHQTGDLYKKRSSLFQIGDVLYILSQKDSLQKIDSLLHSSNPNDKILYEYYSTGILSARKKDVQAMMMMYTHPEKFLGLDDTNAPEKIHSQKKPQHMVTSFPHMDLTANELVSSLALGSYDKLTYFKPMQMTFITDGTSVIYTTGSHTLESMIPGFFAQLDNKNIQVLVQNYNNTVGKRKNDTMSFRTIKNNYIRLPSHQKEWLFMQCKLTRYTAQISAKHDVSNWYNGFNCDSLAVNHGKKVVMMFNPYCADFCLYQDAPSDDIDNLIATSWVTLNMPISQNTTTIIDTLKSGSDPRTLFGNNDMGRTNEYILTLDNIEADPNFAQKASKDPTKKQLLQNMYTTFFQEYIKQHTQSPNGIPINTHKMNCGTSYGKIDIFDEKEENKTLPIFLNSYSDNVNQTTLVIPIDAGEQKELSPKRGIHPMSIEDIFSILQLEGSIYPEGIKEHAANIQHEITASIINNTLKQRENLSFVSYDDAGKMVGYMLAYLGVKERSSDSTPCIYVKDLAVNDYGKGFGLKMIMKCFDSIQQYYPNLPILAELREDTSYPIIKKLLDRYGYEFSQDILSSFANGEKKHDVVIEKI